MKKFLLLVLFIILLSGCSNNRIEYISKYLGISSKNCKIEKDIDTHMGFLGDGDYFAIITCNDEEIDNIKNNWKALPIPEEINSVLEMKSCDNIACLTVFERYNMPRINNGYYYFYDRHSDSKDKLDPKELNNRSSYNFSVGIIDIINKIIYYYELDT